MLRWRDVFGAMLLMAGAKIMTPATLLLCLEKAQENVAQAKERHRV